MSEASKVASRHFLGPALALCAAAGVASVALPYKPVYDAWAWLTWGRELVHLELETGAGPSWKPLTVLVAALATPLGGAAPQALLAVARIGWLAAPVLAGWLAVRLLGPAPSGWRALAAAIAAASVALTADSLTPATRQFTGGISEPLAVALVLGAIAAALEGRSRATLVLVLGASLLRPEAWPFLAACAWHLFRSAPRLRPAALAAVAVVPLAWFLPDLIAAGNPFAGSATAQHPEGPSLATVLGRALAAPLAPVWLGVALALWTARRADERPLSLLLAGAGVWIATVAAMASVGYTGLPRYLAPATAVIAVVGAVGLTRFARDSLALLERRRRPAVAAIAALALAGGAVQAGLRAATIPGDLGDARARARSLDDLFALVDRVGREGALSCEGKARVTDLLVHTALAWKLRIPIERVGVVPSPRRGVVFASRDPAGSGHWRVVSLPCVRAP